MVCHRSSTTSTRVSSPLVQTMKVRRGQAQPHQGGCVGCPTWQQPASTRPIGPCHSSPYSSNSGSMPTIARLCKQLQQWQQPTVHASMHGDVARMSNRSGVLLEVKRIGREKYDFIAMSLEG
ncbi:hypothetical protein Tco_1420413 [Tanacetum coccineum]